jgi:hypothetical protein
LPLDEASLGEGKVSDVLLSLCNVLAFKHDDYAPYVGARVILAHDACFPETPDVGYFVPKVWLEVLQSDVWFEVIVGDDLHEVLFWRESRQR